MFFFTSFTLVCFWLWVIPMLLQWIYCIWRELNLLILYLLLHLVLIVYLINKTSNINRVCECFGATADWNGRNICVHGLSSVWVLTRVYLLFNLGATTLSITCLRTKFDITSNGPNVISLRKKVWFCKSLSFIWLVTYCIWPLIFLVSVWSINGILLISWKQSLYWSCRLIVIIPCIRPIIWLINSCICWYSRFIDLSWFDYRSWSHHWISSWF